MERELPTVNIEGTDFIIDVTGFELREKMNEQNKISFKDMEELENGYSFDFNREEKNIPVLFSKVDLTVEIPEFVVLDPLGMARKYGVAEDEVRTKTDFDFMVDQKAFDMRVNKGMLPTVDIAGHTFYVDIRMDMLRPKDDFLSKGIVFDEIDHYFSEERDAYLIPYDPKKHEFRELDYDNLLRVPKDLIAVEFPFQRVLDPVGWNRNGGWDIKEDLKHIGLTPHFQAKIVPWKETFIHDIIKDNLEKIKEKTEEKKQQNKQDIPTQNQQKNKGRKR